VQAALGRRSVGHCHCRASQTAGGPRVNGGAGTCQRLGRMRLSQMRRTRVFSPLARESRTDNLRRVRWALPPPPHSAPAPVPLFPPFRPGPRRSAPPLPGGPRGTAGSAVRGYLHHRLP
jgi:hypothetical protein